MSVCVSSVPRHAPGGNGSVAVERGVSASQACHGAELLPQRIPGPAHHPGASYGFKHVSQKGKRQIFWHIHFVCFTLKFFSQPLPRIVVTYSMNIYLVIVLKNSAKYSYFAVSWYGCERRLDFQILKNLKCSRSKNSYQKHLISVLWGERGGCHSQGWVAMKA